MRCPNILATASSISFINCMYVCMFEIVLNILQQKTPALFLSALQRLLLN